MTVLFYVKYVYALFVSVYDLYLHAVIRIVN
jgi:hypothetical protein